MRSVISRAVVVIDHRAFRMIAGAGSAALLAAGLLAGCGAPAQPAAARPSAAKPSPPSASAATRPASAATRPASAATPSASTATPSASTATPSASTVAASLPSGLVPQSFTAVSATHWWVLGRVPCGSRDCPAVATTTDGGATFRPLPAPGGPFGPALNSPPAADGIRFADAVDGWAFGPALYATHDGGRHWTAISLPGQVTSLEPGRGEVFAVVTPPSPPCARTGTCTSRTPAPQVWRAQPSSDHWSADPAAAAVSTGLAVHGRSVWVINAMTTRDGPAIGTGLLHSTDSGGHFTLQPEAIPGIACTYSPASDTVVWSYCSGGHFMYAYRSTDGGAHFTAAGPVQPAPGTPDGYPNGSTLEAASPATAVAASDLPASPLVRTIDRGATWRAVQAPPDRSGTWSLIGFTTPEDGFALWEHGAATYQASSAQLWRTTDGGATWSPVKALP